MYLRLDGYVCAYVDVCICAAYAVYQGSSTTYCVVCVWLLIVANAYSDGSSDARVCDSLAACTHAKTHTHTHARTLISWHLHHMHTL